MLNPSTADETEDDPTIRRCIAYARRWLYGGVVIGNIFAFRSTDPRALYEIAPPYDGLSIIGPYNDEALRFIGKRCERVVLAWGVHGTLHNRGREVAAFFDNPYCLGVTSEGHPKHPLYLPADLDPIPFNYGEVKGWGRNRSV